MRPALDKDGKLISPHSREEAVERVRQLRYEADKIDGQLDNLPKMVRACGRHEPGGNFTREGCEDCVAVERAVDQTWQFKAERKLAQFRNEERQTVAWLAGYDAAVKENKAMLHDARELLIKLELMVDFDSEEEAFMDKLDDYCVPQGPSVQGPSQKTVQR